MLSLTHILFCGMSNESLLNRSVNILLIIHQKLQLYTQICYTFFAPYLTTNKTRCHLCIDKCCFVFLISTILICQVEMILVLVRSYATRDFICICMWCGFVVSPSIACVLHANDVDADDECVRIICVIIYAHATLFSHSPSSPPDE